MDTNTQLIEKLKEIQRIQILTDGQMAKKLGCTRQLYQATKTLKVSVGLTILRGATRAFPELIGDAIFFLTNGVQGITTLANINRNVPQPSSSQRWGVLRSLPMSLIHWLKKIVQRLRG